MIDAAFSESASARPISIADWEAMPEDEPGELVDGRLEEEEMSSFVHELVVVALITMFKVWLAGRGGFVFGSDAKFALKPTRGRKPDLSVFLPGGRKPPPRGACRIPPDILVEVVSPTPRDGRRDRVEKLKEYAAFGVRWYGIVEPELRSVQILELGPDSRYTYAASATDGTIEVPGCDGLSLDLDALWKEADLLEASEDGEPTE
jgi:Uma2 family endonuclease